jgi:hypothetical protein
MQMRTVGRKSRRGQDVAIKLGATALDLSRLACDLVPAPNAILRPHSTAEYILIDLGMGGEVHGARSQTTPKNGSNPARLSLNGNRNRGCAEIFALPDPFTSKHLNIGACRLDRMSKR